MRILAAVSLLTFSAIASGQQLDPNNKRGFEPAKLYHFSGIDSVSTFSGNLNIRIPIGQEYAVRPGFTYQFTLTYNSKIWDFLMERTLDGTLRQSMTEKASNAGLGWLLSIGHVTIPTVTNNRYAYVSPDGGVHQFEGTLRTGIQAEQGVQYTRDGSYLRMTLTPRNATPDQVTQIDVETPDGLTHTFSGAGALTSIRDRYGNWMEVSRQGLVWTFTEGRGTGAGRKVTRTHSMTFENAPAGLYTEDNKKQRVKEIRLAAFGQGAAAVYTFHYEDQLAQASRCSIGAPGVSQYVPLLKSVDLPDGSTYQMTYDLTSSTTCWSGSLIRLELPTRAAIEWLHGVYPMARDYCIADERYTAGGIWSDAYPGVSRRTLKGHDGTILEETTYDPVLVEGGFGQIVCDKKTYFDELPPKVFVNTITSKSGKKTESYYSAFRPWEARYAVSDASPAEYGLPLTRTELHEDLPLSTKTFSAAGTHLRSTHVEYETDGFAGTAQINPRQSIGRTLFLDDDGDPDLDFTGTDSEAKRCKDASGEVGPCWVQQSNTDFDGFGHYRRQTTTSNYVGATSRTAYTNYNPGTTPTSHWPSTSPWLLGTYTDSSIQENGVTLVSSATFDAAGSLVSTRTGSGTGALLSVTCRDALGFVTSQRWLGGDGLALPSDPCTASRREGEAILTHTNTFTGGALTAHTAVWEGTAVDVVDEATQTTTQVTPKVIDETLDANTGLPSSTRDSAGLATTYAYDSSSRLTSMQPPGLASTTYTYSNASVANNVLTPAAVDVTTTSSTTALGSIQKQYQFDAAGRIWREKTLMPDDTWTVVETTYDSDGQKASVSEAEKLVVPVGGTELDFRPLKKTTYTAYDAFGRVGRITAADTHATLLTYRGARVTTRSVSVATTLDASQVRLATTERTDAHRRLASVTEGDVTTSYGYHASGNLASVAMTSGAVTQTRAFTYDGRGLLTRETHPEIGAAGNGTVTWSNFDARGQARRKQTGGSADFDLTFTYDPAGRLTAVTKTGSGAHIKQFEFDATGRLSASARYNHTPQLGVITVTEAWQYDASTGLPARRDTAIGTSAFFTDGRSFGHYQHYNDLGLVREVGYPFRTNPDEAARTVQYTYRNGLLTGVTGWASIAYQPNGTISTVTHNGGVTETWTPDPNGMVRPRAITVSRGGTQLWASGNYSFDGAGNIAAIGEQRYRYDALGRLAGWRDVPAAGAFRDESFLYDAFGNRTSTIASGCESTFRCYTSSVLARSITGTTNRYADATYDAAGNVITDTGRTFTYDPVNMPTSVLAGGRTFVYLYTADDERIAAVERLANGSNKTTWTLRGFGNQLLTVRNGDTWKEDQIWRGSSLAGFLTTGPVKRHHSLDHLGSPRVITDDLGNLVGTQTFTPFGEGGALDSGSLQFTGHERDRANLGGGTVELPDYAHARLLDTGAGRFLSVDPTWESADLGTPQSWNRYSYVLNNPINYTDPDGRCPLVLDCVALGALGKAVFVVGTTLVVGAISETEVNGKPIGTHVSEFILRGGGSSGEMAAETMIANYQRQKTADVETSPMQASGADRQKGERAKAGTAAEADQQLTEIEKQQNRTRTGKSDGIIENIDKSKQRAEDKRRRIRNLKDAEDEYGDD